jgi:hypothetical protein
VACTPAPACTSLLAQATELWPGRSRATDGICPSAAHTKANPKSDHERGEAVDLTHDPANGVDCQRIVLEMIGRRDGRVKYLIHNRLIYNAPVFLPVPYTGKNPHTSHLHVSIKPGARNDTAPWFPNGKAGGVLTKPAPSGGGAATPSPANTGGALTVDMSRAAQLGLGVDLATTIGGEAVPDALKPLVTLAAFLLDPSGWLRVAYFLIGLVLIILAAILIIGDTRPAKALASAAAVAL